MWTFLRNTPAAMVPPISAAAMLSRKDESTKTITSSMKPPFQSSGRIVRQHLGHLAALEVVREQREAEQQAEQVGEDHPLVRHVQRQAAKSRSGLEAGEAELVDDDHAKPDERHLQDVAMEQRDADQRQAEQDEINWDIQALSATRTSSSIFFASPNSIRLLSL